MKNASSRKNKVRIILASLLILLVTIAGIRFFLDVRSMKVSTEIEIALIRASACDMAIAGFIQKNGGISAAAETWNSARSDSERYELIKPYLSFEAEGWSEVLPVENYHLELPKVLIPLTKTAIFERVDY